MKIKVDGNRLQDGLRKVIGVANAKITPPILGNVMLEAKDGKVNLTATNLDVTLITSVECEVEEAGATTVPAKMFQSVVAALPVGTVEINSSTMDKMRVIGGETSFKISGIAATEFPKLAKVKDDCVFTMEAKDLKTALRKTAYAQSTEDVRRTLKGIHFDFAGDQLKTVATDGRRLAVSLVKAKWKCKDTKFTIPTDAVREVQKLIADDGTVTIKYSGNMAVYEIEKAATTMYCKTAEDGYPNYANVIPKETQFTATCDRERFIDMMNRAKVMAVNNTPSVKLVFDKGTLDATVVGMDEGEGRDKFAIKYDGEKMEKVFNPYYLHETLSSIDADDVKVEMSENGPIIVKGDGESGLAVVMPLRLG